MWRDIANNCSRSASNLFFGPLLLNRAHSPGRLVKGTFFPDIDKSIALSKITFLSQLGAPQLGFQRNGNFCCREEFLLLKRSSPVIVNGLSCKGYASTAEAVEVSHTDMEEDSVSVDAEFQELMKEVRKEEKRQYSMWYRKQKNQGGVRIEMFEALKRRQVKNETEAWEHAVKEYRDLLNEMCQQKLAPNLPYMKSLFLGWFEPLRNRIAEEQELIRKGKNKSSYAKYFDQLPAEMMAVITMHKLMSMLMTGGEYGYTRVVQAACVVGEAIEQEVRIHHLLEKTKKKRVENGAVKQPDISGEGTLEEKKLHKKIETLMKKQKVRELRQLVNKKIEYKPWGQEARAKVGSRLIELIIQTAYIQPPANQLADAPPDIRPAFIHTSKIVPKEIKSCTRRYGIIRCDPLVHKGLERTARHMVIPYMPMLVPPIKWSGYEKGAYFYLPSYVMRTHGARQQREVVKRAPREQLETIFEALDTLGMTRWRVNKRVLSVIDRIWANGGSLGDLVDRSDIPLPEEPDTEDEALLRAWKWSVKTIKKKNAERHSQRCDTELKLAVARKYRDEDGFFYPHNLDFRGRAYPMHPHLNHLGSDFCRGILEFSEGRPLGESGLRWLKIHLANLFANGVDKLSHEGRLAFTENHLDDIFDSADRPLEGTRWWLNAEDPFQCLAACINLTEALRSPSPEKCVSYIPVHQDGSCNGLQHYAALGRDKIGAAAVNLVVDEKPADVYSGIASRVLAIMKEDAQKDPNLFPDALRARILIDQVDRKLVKQTVMTSVYGVTYVGARDQIKKRLRERNVIPDNAELFGAACYAAKVTMTALGQMFEAARSIMNWLGECAKIISMENEAVQWTTPLGLPVVQPYRQSRRQLIRTSLQILTLHHESNKVTLLLRGLALVMAKRQRTAFPPNFVHSLDGSHMMMTAIACKKEGLNFAGVHDSYWTHACDVDKMNRILREKFVELYEAPILENLLESFEKSFPSLNFPPLPARGDFDLHEVLRSPYFFN